MKSFIAALFAVLAVSTQAAPNAVAIATKYNCLACHQVDRKVVGPAYRDVATKYRGDKTAEARLMEKVKKGGVGVWGSLAMPAQQIKDADLKIVVQWVLSQK